MTSLAVVFGGSAILAVAALYGRHADRQSVRDLRSLRSNEKWRDELRRMWAR